MSTYNSQYTGLEIDNQIEYVKNTLPGIIESISKQIEDLNDNKAEKSSVPTKVSQIQNDKKYTTEEYVGEYIEEYVAENSAKTLQDAKDYTDEIAQNTDDTITENINNVYSLISENVDNITMKINELQSGKADIAHLSYDEIDNFCPGQYPTIACYSAQNPSSTERDMYSEAPFETAIIITNNWANPYGDGNFNQMSIQFAFTLDSNTLYYRWADADDYNSFNGITWTKTVIPTKLSQLINDSGYLTDILDGSVTTEKIDDSSVTASKIANGAISTEKVADGAITSEKIGLEEVKSANINDGAVLTEKIADEAVTPLKLSTDVKENIESREKSANKGVPNGYAPLDSEGKIPNDYLHGSTLNTTVSGYHISITDHVEGEKVIDYKVYGNSTQETRIGKNLLPYPYWYLDGTYTQDGITFTDNGDGTITVNGTATSEVQFFLTEGFSLSSNKAHVISGSESDNIVIKCAVQLVDSEGQQIIVTLDTASNPIIDFSLYEGLVPNETYITIVISSGTTISNVVIKPQVEVGTTATSYEQHGVMPSNQYPSQIKSVGDLVTNTSSEYYGKYDVPVTVFGSSAVGEILYSTTEHIYLDEPLRKKEEYSDYIDYKNQMVVRQIEVLDDTGTKTIDESFGILSTPTTENITVPDLTVPNSEIMNIFIDTKIQPYNIDLTYYYEALKSISAKVENDILYLEKVGGANS